jgi:hypothetical protein
MHRYAHVGFEGRPWVPEALVWRARAAAKNYGVDQFLHELKHCCDSMSERREVVFHLGRELRLDATLSDRWINEGKYVRFAVKYYNRICEETRAAVEAWLIVSRRMGLYKDLRRVIACMVWQTREECLEIGGDVEDEEEEPATKKTRRDGLEELQTGDSEAMEEEEEEQSPKKAGYSMHKRRK